MSEQTKQPNSKKSNGRLNNYAKYSNLAFVMIAIICIGVFGGIKLDEIVKFKFPVFTVLFSILFVFLSIYYAVKDFIKK